MPTELLSPVKTDSTDDRRRAFRRPHVCEAWVRSPTEPEDAKSEVLSLDISRHGLGFESPRPLPVGCFYWIELSFGEKDIAQEIRVISCVESETVPGAYRIGAEFH